MTWSGRSSFAVGCHSERARGSRRRAIRPGGPGRPCGRGRPNRGRSGRRRASPRRGQDRAGSATPPARRLPAARAAGSRPALTSQAHSEPAGRGSRRGAGRGPTPRGGGATASVRPDGGTGRSNAGAQVDLGGVAFARGAPSPGRHGRTGAARASGRSASRTSRGSDGSSWSWKRPPPAIAWRRRWPRHAQRLPPRREDGPDDPRVAGLARLAPGAQGHAGRGPDPAGARSASARPAARSGASHSPMAPSRAPVESGSVAEPRVDQPGAPDERLVGRDPAAQREAVGRHVALDEREERRPLGRSAQRAEHRRVERVVAPALDPLARPGQRPREQRPASRADPLGDPVGERPLAHQGREVMARGQQDGCLARPRARPARWPDRDPRRRTSGAPSSVAKKAFQRLRVLARRRRASGTASGGGGAVEGDQDRARLELAHPGFGTGRRAERGRPVAAREQAARVEHDDPRPARSDGARRGSPGANASR